jgi:cation transport ATPase
MTGAVITWLIRFGDWIPDLTAAGSKRAVSELLEFRQRRAWVVQNGTVIEVPASAVAIGDVVVVYHGETKLGTRLPSPSTAHASTSKPAASSRVTW